MTKTLIMTTVDIDESTTIMTTMYTNDMNMTTPMIMIMIKT